MSQNNWVQPFRFLVIASLFFVAGWFIFAAWPLIQTMIVAGLLAYVLQPLVRLLTDNTRLNRNAAVNIVYFAVLVIVFSIPSVLIPIVVRQVSTLTANLDLTELQTEIEQFLDQPFVPIGGTNIPLEGVLNTSGETLNQGLTMVATYALSLVGAFSGNLVWILVGFVLVYYLLKDSPAFIANAIDYLISPNYQDDAHQLVREIDAVWGGFLRGQIVLIIAVGVLSGLGVAALGVPGAVIIGLMAGFFDVIPSIGPIVASFVAVILAYTQGSTFLPVSNWVLVLLVLAVLVLVQQIENIWIRPAVMGHRLKLHPALVIAGVLGGLAIFGVLAAIIVIPLMATIGILVRYFYCIMNDIPPFPDTLPYIPKEIATPEPSLEGSENGSSEKIEAKKATVEKISPGEDV